MSGERRYLLVRAVDQAQGPADGRHVHHLQQVLPVRLGRRGLMLGHRVHQRVACASTNASATNNNINTSNHNTGGTCAGVAEEEAAHAHGQRAEEAPGREHGEHQRRNPAQRPGRCLRLSCGGEGTNARAQTQTRT